MDWYKEIKKIQGSVEVTSVNQVEDINKFGAYTISCKGKKILPSIEDAIVLEISRAKAAKRSYSFNDLRDLESKLVLIRGRSTKGGAEIDRFLDVSFNSFLDCNTCVCFICRYFTWFVELQKPCMNCKLQDTLSIFLGL